MFRSNAHKSSSVSPGYLVKLFLRNGNGKNGTWSSPRTLLKFYKPCGVMKLPGSSRQSISRIVDDVRAAIMEDYFEMRLNETNDNLTEITDNLSRAICESDAEHIVDCR